MVGDRERALEAGCDDYISKPINLPELIKMIKMYLNRAKPGKSPPPEATSGSA
jgi:DNA-binding response OmpR family regulator